VRLFQSASTTFIWLMPNHSGYFQCMPRSAAPCSAIPGSNQRDRHPRGCHSSIIGISLSTFAVTLRRSASLAAKTPRSDDLHTGVPKHAGNRPGLDAVAHNQHPLTRQLVAVALQLSRDALFIAFDHRLRAVKQIGRWSPAALPQPSCTYDIALTHVG